MQLKNRLLVLLVFCGFAVQEANAMWARVGATIKKYPLTTASIGGGLLGGPIIEGARFALYNNEFKEAQKADCLSWFPCVEKLSQKALKEHGIDSQKVAFTWSKKEMAYMKPCGFGRAIIALKYEKVDSADEVLYASLKCDGLSFDSLEKCSKINDWKVQSLQSTVGHEVRHVAQHKLMGIESFGRSVLFAFTIPLFFSRFILVSPVVSFGVDVGRSKFFEYDADVNCSKDPTILRAGVAEYETWLKSYPNDSHTDLARKYPNNAFLREIAYIVRNSEEIHPHIYTLVCGMKRKADELEKENRKKTAGVVARYQLGLHNLR